MSTWDYLPQIMRLEHETGHLFAHNTRVKNVWSYISVFSYAFLEYAGNNLSLNYIYKNYTTDFRYILEFAVRL